MRLLFLICALLFAGEPLAHQQKEAYTNIKFNQRNGLLEIQHRFYLHDAEHAAQQVIDKNADLISDPVSREAFAYYATSTFSLKNDGEMILPLEYVGTELQGKYLWVYQETPITQEMKSFYIKMTTLQELWSDQTNHINIERNKKVESVRLHFEDKWQQVVLQKMIK
ncbi:MAG: hypothetical protein HAW66_09965 [Shewanella sp.]|nr:hypothetical protein [Shewanella sp.]